MQIPFTIIPIMSILVMHRKNLKANDPKVINSEISSVVEPEVNEVYALVPFPDTAISERDS